MTEIPEHLLQRSRERRAALSGDDGGSSDDGGGAGDGGGGSANAPVKAAAAAPAAMPAHPEPVAPEPPKPASPVVQAFERRKKIPFWAMSVLAMIPVWAYVFVGTLDPIPVEGSPEIVGEEIYSGNCASCHGGSGGGGVGPALAGGAIYETWPSFEDHFEWVRLGSNGWTGEYGNTYGATAKPVAGGMPGFPASSISDADLLALVLHERTVLGGENPDPLDAERLRLAAEKAFEHPELTIEEILAEVNAELGEG